PTFLLTACYKYKTRANPVVCLDTNPTDKLSDKVCNPNGASPGSQGAPIAVSSIEQETTPKATYFRIQISNAGGGVAFDANSIGSCPHLLDYKELNKIRYYVPTLGEGQAFGECKPDHDKLRLVNGQATIFCKFPHSQQQGAYQTTLNIELEYGYKNSISQQVDIRSIDE
ncbi:hypothetical protein HON01_11875, partial [Candidatus Woesearchaeota archaeon]|nr:hypothetical protein [Candidatus Woesearchaeota archaeon]